MGHSWGGFTVTQVAERIPHRIARLVDVSAFVPLDGQTLPTLVELEEFQSSPAGRYQRVDLDASLSSMPTEHAPDVLFGDCAEEIAWAAAVRSVHETWPTAASRCP
ncbi:hypothetical protein QRX50_25405 [Amycolatopsis carbonis]|uniref:AB hydrolase-1 domain-containing protein n=1 Tax=Amycolatopsis carbonis TaxID=715471 RepID=A0A9Y2I907_9PSEU|nr:alpha/beta fold hydrolase [Amycolatopsis sp. 2-15]WIX74911.1 hypothetical protein QRX50_25405 [Amycolatopsis sp. 2-15]